jgi:DNA-binding SARP family transcriptional activator/Tfp pilus assembly protein PilF
MTAGDIYIVAGSGTIYELVGEGGSPAGHRALNLRSVSPVSGSGQGEHPTGDMVTADAERSLLVQVLGPVRAWRGERELKVGGPQRQAVVGMLAMRANQAVSRSELIDGVWGDDPPPSAVNALHVHVAGLRRTLEPHRASRAPGKILVIAGPGYSLRLEPEQLDAGLFDRHLDTARALRADGELSDAARSLDKALQLWQAAPLSGVPGPWAEIERIRLAESRMIAVEERTQIMIMLGRHADAVAELRRLVCEHPLREGLRGQLMLVLYRCGRQADALAAFTEARSVLIRELGIEPSPELRRLQEQILAADPTLDVPSGIALLAHPSSVATASLEREPSVPAQLPADADPFTGRAGELAALDGLTVTIGSPEREGKLSTGTAGAVIAVSGTAGVGKTALAVRWARRVRDTFPDGQLYINLRGYDPGQPVPPGDALAGFLCALGMPAQHIPREEDERAAAYRTLLDGRRMLVVLDNARDVEQVRPMLPGSPSSLVLVTSRDSLAGLVARHGARRLELDTLPAADAIALLRTLIGRRADTQPEATATLARQCARLPLALRVAAELAVASPVMTMAQLAAELADEQRRLDLLDAGGDQGSAVRGVLSWSYRHLAAEPARAFRLLGLHPGPDIDPYAAAALTGTTHAHACHLLELLTRTHLIHRTGPRRYGMHDLLRAYAADLADAEDTAGERHGALTRLFDYYTAAASAAMDAIVPAERHLRPRNCRSAWPAPALADLAAARTWLDGERAVLVCVATYTAAGRWPGHAIRLAGTLYRYYETGCNYTDAITMHSSARDAARRTRDRAAEATALTNLGIIDWRQGRYGQAVGHHGRALEISGGIGDRSGVAIALSNLGIAYERLGRYQEAADLYGRSAALHGELGDRSSQAISLANLGGADSRRGRYAQASSNLRRALVVFRELGDHASEGGTLAELGFLDRQLGRHQQAAEHYRQALDLASQNGNRAGVLEARNGLGAALLAAGQPWPACAEHRAALDLASQTGDRYEQARAHDGLARAHQVTGGPDRARDHWAQALALFTGLGSPESGDVGARLAALDSVAAQAPARSA